MRMALAVLIALSAGALASAGSAKADPYRWCADYGGSFDGGGGTNCYFLTLEQCRAAISGMGGFCRENGFYDGRPVGGVAAPVMPRRKDKRHSG